MRAIVLGDPTYFRIKAGNNPHTRNRWGLRQSVSLEKAIRQWKRLKDQLSELGVKVLVVPPEKDWPGMVFPANAGVVMDQEGLRPFSEKIFLMSRLNQGRCGEEFYYQKFFEKLGFKIEGVDCPFEGEADFFQAGSYTIFTYGRIIRPHFKLRWGLPPYERVYGFRTDFIFLEKVKKYISPEKILPLELIDERFYHGDTVCCSFGLHRQYVMSYLLALSSESQEVLKNAFGEKLIALSGEDAFRYAANSFYLETDEGRFLLIPQGLSRRLLDQLVERAMIPIEIDVSEFYEKGGGSIKCMILDLGPVFDKEQLLKLKNDFDH
ncbi:MAG: hypothetical protein HYS07_02445 [Chlamydiae bacterium]|nr:hypothetical protein [Chlamydiota bacterium]MBI3276691.1 hypothetical protein [Chlamydiota bacterium]